MKLPDTSCDPITPELPAMIVLRTCAVPAEFVIPTPENMPPLLPTIVLLFTSRIPALDIPPPLLLVLPVKVQLLTCKIVDGLLRMPPPEELPLFPIRIQFCTTRVPL